MTSQPPPDHDVDDGLAGIEIKVREHGPYKVTGAVRLIDHAGRPIDHDPDRPLVLCRCGHSASKPLCDGSHRDSGFEG